MRYTLVRMALSFALGAVVGLVGGRFVPEILPWALAGAFLIAGIAGCRRPWGKAVLLVAVFFLGLGRATSDEAFPEWLILRAQGMTEVSGTVISYPSLGDGYVVFTLRPDALPGDLRVTWFAPDPELLYGDRVTVAGSVRLPEAFDGFDYPAYLARRGIFATMRADGDGAVRRAGAAGSAVLRLGDRIRQAVLGQLADALGAREAALAQGLLFGDRAALADDVEDAFRRTGLMHILAVSGLHLGIVLGGLWFALRWARVRAVVAYPLVGVVVLAVLWIVGPRVSLVRASLLFGFLGLGSVLADCGLILRRSIDPLNGLAAAGLVLVALQPSQLADAGFQLTFAATAGILLAVADRFRVLWERPIEALAAWAGPLRRPVRAALTLVVISAAAQAGVAPVVAWQFGTFHPLLIGFNLVVLPLVTVALAVGLPGLLLLAAGSPAIVVAPFGWALTALSGAVERLAAIPFAELAVSRWIGVWLGGVVLFLVAAVAYSERSS